jgi:hypothetical protein
MRTHHRNQDCVIGIFDSLADARTAVRSLEQKAWRTDQISLITRGHESELNVLGSMQQGDRMEKTAAIGSAAGAALGFLAGSSLFIIPGVGPVLFAGAMASGITGGLVGGLVGAMSGWGVKDDHVRKYEHALSEGKTLVVLTGDPSGLAEGEAILQESDAETVVLHAESADSAHVDK